MIVDWLGSLLVALTLIGCGMMWIAILAMLGQLLGYLALRGSGLARERRMLATLPADSELPDVVIQLPSFNEGAIVERGVANAIALDWPKNKLHVQICDDSTDHTTEIARAAAAKAVADGFDVQVIHRTDRTGFKAGSLQVAMNQTGFQYFAILDIDFITPRDFLRRAMAVLLSDPDLAFVQTRLSFFNAGDNLLARGQALLLDQHYAVEQPLRDWSGQGLPFNGTGGIWRRKAIEAAGGWRGDTLCEDWELSFHARLRGMCGTYVTTVFAAGELPADWRSWTVQQHRWAKGIGQVAWSLLPQAFSEPGLSLKFRLGTIVPLALWFCYAAFPVTWALAVAAIALKPSLAKPLGLAVAIAYGATVCVMAAVTWVASRAGGRHRSVPQFARDYLIVPVLALYVSWLHLRSIPAITRGERAVFERTPKRGVSAPL